MNTFEQKYYESETFWEGDMLQDPANRGRIIATASLVPQDTKTLADIGCGNGVFVNYLFDSHSQIEITGVDRSRNALKYVHTKKVEADVENLPFEKESFDCVTCLEVIEHLPIPVYKKSLAELARIAKKHIIISVPYSERLEDSYTRCPSCKTAFNKEIHLRSFEDKDVQELFNDYGFVCESTQKLNPTATFWGHHIYRKLFYKEQFTTWNAPICPLCGYEQDPGEPVRSNGLSPDNRAGSKRKFISYLTALPKLFWPKEIKYYWILARYVRATS